MFANDVFDNARNRQQALLREARQRSLLREAQNPVKPLFARLAEVFRPARSKGLQVGRA